MQLLPLSKSTVGSAYRRVRRTCPRQCKRSQSTTQIPLYSPMELKITGELPIGESKQKKKSGSGGRHHFREISIFRFLVRKIVRWDGLSADYFPLPADYGADQRTTGVSHGSGEKFVAAWCHKQVFVCTFRPEKYYGGGRPDSQNSGAVLCL